MPGAAAGIDRFSTRPEAVTQPRFYFPELDILRFLAFLSVFIFHLPGYRGDFYAHLGFVGSVCLIGGFGVDLFFALSAFLITRLLLDERRTTGRLEVRLFYMRRILRIWPLFFFFLGLTFVLSRSVYLFAMRISPTSSATWTRGIPGLALLLGNFVGATANPVIAPLWSICAEEQFYLL